MSKVLDSHYARIRMIHSALRCFTVNESLRVRVTPKGAVQYFRVPSSGEAGGDWTQAVRYWRGVKKSG